MLENLIRDINNFKETKIKLKTVKTSNKFLFSYSFNYKNIDLIKLSNYGKERNKSLYFSQPSSKFKFLTQGELVSLSFTGGRRFLDSKEQIEKLRGSIISNASEFPNFNIPLFICASKFSYLESEDKLWDDYKNLEWLIPRFYFIRSKEETIININFYDDEKIDSILNELHEILGSAENTNGEKQKFSDSEIKLFESDELWKSKVEYLSEKIAESKYNKVVLSRQAILNLRQKLNFNICLSSLEENYPYCTIFSFTNGGSKFFGASPEKLLRLTNGKIEVDALAGSITRGDSKADDDYLAQKLKSSKKDLFEHKLVVDFIIDALKKVSDEIHFNEEPDVRILSNIQHLWTKITANLQNSNSLFDLLYLLHPTPAVCGDPRDISFKSILDIEPFDRGLYSGFIGWFNFDDHADFVVALRSALLKNKMLHAFAGCGIVEGSDPQSELEESNLKLTPILSLFENEKICKS